MDYTMHPIGVIRSPFTDRRETPIQPSRSKSVGRGLSRVCRGVARPRGLLASDPALRLPPLGGIQLDGETISG